MHRRKYSGEESPNRFKQGPILTNLKECNKTDVFMIIEEEGRHEAPMFYQNPDEFENFSSDSSFELDEGKVGSERVLSESVMEEDAGLVNFHRETGMTPEKRKRKLSSEEECDELVEMMQKMKGAWMSSFGEKGELDVYERTDNYKNGTISGSIKVFHAIPEWQGIMTHVK
jgi:hypothetical protein